MNRSFRVSVLYEQEDLWVKVIPFHEEIIDWYFHVSFLMVEPQDENGQFQRVFFSLLLLPLEALGNWQEVAKGPVDPADWQRLGLWAPCDVCQPQTGQLPWLLRYLLCLLKFWAKQRRRRCTKSLWDTMLWPPGGGGLLSLFSRDWLSKYVKFPLSLGGRI